MKHFVILVFFLFSTSCSLFYNVVVNIKNPKRITNFELQKNIEEKLIYKTNNIYDYYYINDDSLQRVKSFNSSVVGLYMFFNENGLPYKRLNLNKGCMVDDLVFLSKNYKELLKEADTSKMNSKSYLIFKSLNELKNSTLAINPKTELNSNKKTIILFWSLFADDLKNLNELSKIIVDNYNSDSFQIVRVNCDLVNSKYPEFQTKVKKGKTMKEAEIDFFIK